MGLDVYIKEMDRKTQTNCAFSPRGNVGYFRDKYNNYSLANWLTRNIDKEARGKWGLAIFTERSDINTEKWRKDLLLMAKRWYKDAKKLKSKITYAGYPHHHKEKVSKEETSSYIDWCKELLIFAEKLNEIKGTVTVSA